MGEARRCPACRGWILSNERHCAVCGPELGRPESNPAPVAAADPFASAELDLSPPPPSPPAPPPPPVEASPPSSTLQDEGHPDSLPPPPSDASSPDAAPVGPGSDVEDDPLEPPLRGDLELEIDERALKPAPASLAPATVAGSAATATRGTVTTAPSRTGERGTREGGDASAPRQREEPPLPRHEVLAVAEYGQPPEGWIASVFYVIHVAQRWRALREELEAARLAARATRRTAEEALLVFARRVAEQRKAFEGEQADALAPLFARVERAEMALGAARGSEQEQAGPLRARRAALEQRIAEAEQATAPARNAEARALTRVQIAEGELRSLKGRRQRVEIELRNARQLATPDPERIAALETELGARRTEEEIAERKLAALQAELTEAQARLQAELQGVRSLQEEYDQLGAALRALSEEAGAALEAAEQEHRDALLQLGEAAMAMEVPALDGPERSAAQAAWRSWLARRRRERLVEAALDAWDRDAMRRGAILLAVPVVVVLVALGLAIFR